ncbi:MAG TPA: MFS transporter, partial [Algoriphagus sp.]|nr:MFS transporter [Algoriphagus sp.]
LFGISLDLIGDWDLLIWFLIIMTAQFLAFGIPAGRNRKI